MKATATLTWNDGTERSFPCVWNEDGTFQNVDDLFSAMHDSSLDDAWASDLVDARVRGDESPYPVRDIIFDYDGDVVYTRRRPKG